jgi:hypothetical protein
MLEAGSSGPSFHFTRIGDWFEETEGAGDNVSNVLTFSEDPNESLRIPSAFLGRKQRKIRIQTVTKVNRLETIIRIELVELPTKCWRSEFPLDVMVLSYCLSKASRGALTLHLLPKTENLSQE